jgi:hypothetical protein
MHQGLAKVFSEDECQRRFEVQFCRERVPIRELGHIQRQADIDPHKGVTILLFRGLRSGLKPQRECKTS